MSLETEVAGLTFATTQLLNAVNVSKSTLDSSVNDATAKANLANTKATEASTSADNSATSATTAINAASSALASAVTATTNASAALASSTSASTSASTATTKASEASTSATNAAASAASAASNASVAASGGIRFDQSQSLTTGQKTQAQSNIGLAIGTNVQAWDADLDAIAALTGLAGLLKKTAANTWGFDTSVYLTGITSSQVTTALGFTPYNATNPSGYITSSSLTPYALLAGAAFTGAVSATSFTGAHEGTVGATTPSTAKFLHAHSPEITITDGASLAWNTALGQVAKVTLGGSRTFAAPTNLQTGAFYSVFLIQDATGSRTVSWNTVFAFTGGTAPTLSTAANSVDQIAFRYDGTKLREVGRSLGIA